MCGIWYSHGIQRTWSLLHTKIQDLGSWDLTGFSHLVFGLRNSNAIPSKKKLLNSSVWCIQSSKVGGSWLHLLPKPLHITRSTKASGSDWWDDSLHFYCKQASFPEWKDTLVYIITSQPGHWLLVQHVFIIELRCKTVTWMHTAFKQPEELIHTDCRFMVMMGRK